MEKIILGILILKRLTIYEIRKIISLNFQSMCSDSLGSIQAAINKLLKANLITVHEFVEKSVNKKRYSITDAGRDVLIDWIKTPIDMEKAKNIELGKLLFMGLVPKAERAVLLDEVISSLQEELTYLENIHANVSDLDSGVKQFMTYIEQDSEYSLGLQRASGNENMFENAQEIARFQVLSLQLGIDTARFQIKWFKSLKKSEVK